MGHHSDYLFAEPSFWEGVARIVDFGNTLNEYNRSLSGSAADDLATRLDWNAVGLNIYDSMREYDKAQETEKRDTISV